MKTARQSYKIIQSVSRDWRPAEFGLLQRIKPRRWAGCRIRELHYKISDPLDKNLKKIPATTAGNFIGLHGRNAGFFTGLDSGQLDAKKGGWF